LAQTKQSSTKNECSEKDTEILQKAGVKFGSAVPGDPLFQYATLPTGWKKVGTDHAMWSNLLDDKGRIRALIFYKAAFYDRAAHMQACCFYRVDCDKDYKKNPNMRHVIGADSDTPIVTFNEQEYGESRRNACTWLDLNRPGWTDPAKYWT